MSDRLSFEIEWQALANGSPEERSTFADIGIRANDIWLTEAENAFINRVVQSKVPLSAYRLAEWLVWNWWRLRWEPRRNSSNWSLAHRMTAIGGGYVWPNVTIDSDGERVALDSRPTQSRPSEPLRYISQVTAIISAAQFETGVDDFVERVCGKLLTDKVSDSNLERSWSDLLDERRDPETSRRRKLEALLGFDPDEAGEDVLERLIGESEALGESGVQELAADSEQREPPTAGQISDWAAHQGLEWQPRDAVKLSARSARNLPTHIVAWKRGAAAAMALREGQDLGSNPISNARLSQMAGTSISAIENVERSAPLNFALASSATVGRLALKSRYKSGRRFHLARLLGDKIAVSAHDRFIPATNAGTYRQRVQRSFAAELLCPFDSLMDRLRDDRDDDALSDAAAYFDISPMAVRAILANHHIIERDDVSAVA